MFATVSRSARSRRSSEGFEVEESFVSSSEESSIMRRLGIVKLYRYIVQSRVMSLSSNRLANVASGP